MNKLYAIQYEVMTPSSFNSGTVISSGTPLPKKIDNRHTVYFDESQKGEFIKKYYELKSLYSTINIKVYRASGFEELDIEKILDF